MLLGNDRFNSLRFEILVYLLLYQMSSQFLAVIVELLINLFNFAVQRKERMISFLLVYFLSKERDYIDIWSFLNLNNYVEDFNVLACTKLYCVRFTKTQKLPNAIINSSKCNLIEFEYLN